jgi:hypothetical protein
MAPPLPIRIYNHLFVFNNRNNNVDEKLTNRRANTIWARWRDGQILTMACLYGKVRIGIWQSGFLSAGNAVRDGGSGKRGKAAKAAEMERI